MGRSDPALFHFFSFVYKTLCFRNIPDRYFRIKLLAMKTQFLLFILTILSLGVHAQVPNEGFENWTDETYFRDPSGFQTSNLQAYFAAQQEGVIRTSESHSGDYAALLQSTESEFGLIPGMVAIGEPSAFGFITPEPFVGSPISISMWCNYSVADGDQALAALALYSEDGTTEVGSAAFVITGTSEGFELFEMNINYSSSDPVAFMGFAIFNTDPDFPVSGSWLVVDDIQFGEGVIIDELVSNGVTPQFPNGDFEDWLEFAGQEADDWSSSNLYTLLDGASVSRSETAYEGSYSALIENRSTFFDKGAFSFLILGSIEDEGIGGGIPMNELEMPTTLSGFYQFDESNQEDSASVYILLKRWNELSQQYEDILEYRQLLGLTSGWTNFEIEVPGWQNLLDAGIYPDLVNIGFSAGEIPVDDGPITGTYGAKMWVDALTLTTTFGSSVKESTQALLFQLYPNPSEGQTVLLHNGPIESITIRDASGRMVQQWNSPSRSIEISGLAAGLYVVSAADKGIVHTERLVIR